MPKTLFFGSASTSVGRTILAGCALIASACPALSAPVPYRVPDMTDRLLVLDPARVEVRGWLGERVQANARNRLAQVDLEPLLAGFRKKPGTHPWIGEHIGKWMHAATLAWADTGDPQLRDKLRYAAAELIEAQESDGYLGTYLPENRFKVAPGNDWDVWSHKYCLMGLLTYYHFTGEQAALDASRRAADLLLATFGPDKKSILSAGTHVGMAATSVLEPMVLLYRHTADERYLDFCKYIVGSWREPGGPRIIDSLLEHGQVNRTANSKGYEMLSNLVGLCELYRVTGDPSLLEPAIRAWEDITRKRLYLTGSATQGEHFGADFHLPNAASSHVAETCVTTTWIQLNSQLFRLTGQARYGEELERTFYNHLAAAQRPDGAEWCYFSALEGTKPYGPGINCCVSSGPRGMALAPLHVFLLSPAAGERTLFVNVFEDARATAEVDGKALEIEQRITGREIDRIELTFEVKNAPQTRFGLAFRVPRWAKRVSAVRPGLRVAGRASDGWWRLAAREWKRGDRIVLRMALRDPLVEGTHGNDGLAALQWGPYVLAYDDADNRGEPGVGAGLARPARLKLAGPNKFEALVRSVSNPKPHPATFTTFGDAGATGGRYRVWLRGPDTALPKLDGMIAAEERSREGNVKGSIIDRDPATFVVTFDNTRRKEDWYAVELVRPREIRGIVFAHGKDFHDGGWFDASSGKPRVQVRREPGGEWETVGELTGYPDTTSTDSKGLKPGQAFEVRFSQPRQGVAVRVAGQPASGDNPAQAFSSCAELRPIAE